MIVSTNLPLTNITPKIREAQNKAIKVWTRSVVRDLRKSATIFRKGKKQDSVTRPSPEGPLLKVYKISIKSYTEYKLANSIGYRLHKRYDLIEGAGIRLQRHGVFVQKGVGRGYQMRNGRVVRVNASDLKIKKQYRSLSGGPIRRFPVDWFNAIIDRRTEEIADTIMNINENAVVNTLRLRIV